MSNAIGAEGVESGDTDSWTPTISQGATDPPADEPIDTAVDTGTIGWLLPEIVSAFDSATAALRRFRAGAAGVDRKDVDLAPLRVARSHLHQAHGAVEMSELAGVARLTESIEELFALFEDEPGRCDATALDAVVGGCRAVVEYLEDLQAGARQQPLYLYPSYRDLRRALGADRIQAADLFVVDLGIRAPRDEQGTALDERALRAQRRQFEKALLGYVRDQDDGTALAALKRTVEAIDGSVARTSKQGQAQQRAFWWSTRALFDALANGGFDGAPTRHADLKRLAGRINLQIRRLGEGSAVVAERLFTDVLFFVAIAAPVTALVREVQARYRLVGSVPTDFEVQRYARVDSVALRSAREALASAKAIWSAIVAGDVGEIGHFATVTGTLTHALGSLERRGLGQVAQVIDGIATDLGFDPRQPAAGVGLDVAMALLFLEASLERARSLDDASDARAALVVARVEASALGQESPPAMADWLDRMSREAEERLTLATFVAELQANLRSTEKLLDAFFRNPADRAGLDDAQKALAQASGALALLGHEDVHLAIDHARRTIDRFRSDATLVDQAAFEQLAQSLGAVGFYVEQIKRDRIDVAAFHFDVDSGRFTAEMGRTSSSAAAAGPDDEPDEATAGTVDGQAGDLVDEKSTGRGAEATLEDEMAARAADANELAARLRESPDDEDVRGRLAVAVDEVRQDAMLIDDRPLRDEAAALLASLRGRDLDGLDAHEDGSAPEAAGQLADRVADLATRANRSVGMAPSPGALLWPTLPLPFDGDAEAIDAELLEVFLTEAGTVLGAAKASMRALDADPLDRAAAIELRRGFHTLKGSGRMVGLAELGDAAWSIEETLNGVIADQRRASADLRSLVDYAVRYLADWVDELRVNGRSSRIPDALIEAARAVRDADSGHAIDDKAEPLGERLSGGEDVVRAAFAAPASPVDALLESGEDNAEETFPHLEFSSVEPQRPEPTGPPGPVDDDLDELDPFLADESDFSALFTTTPSAPANDHGPAVERFEDADLRFGVEPEETAVDDASTAASNVVPFTVQPAPGRNDEYRRIGSMTLSVALFDVFLTEADERLRVLTQDFAEWRHELDRYVSDDAIRAAHSLAGSSATVGLLPARDLATAIEDVLQALWRKPVVLTTDRVGRLQDAVESLRKMLHRFAAERLPEPDVVRIADLVALQSEFADDDYAPPDAIALADQEAFDLAPVADEAFDLAPVDEEFQLAPLDEEIGLAPFDDGVLLPRTPIASQTNSLGQPTDLPATLVEDDIDPELLDVFVVEGGEIFPQIATLLRAWQAEPTDATPARMLLRHLHTLKGSARMAGAMRLGEVAHDLEARVQSAALARELPPSTIEELLAAYDRGVELFDRLQHPETAGKSQAEEPGSADGAAAMEFDDGPAEASPSAAASPRRQKPGSQQAVRVSSETLDRLVNLAGEVSISRARIENEVRHIKGATSELNDNVGRLRSQLREIELQAELEMQSQLQSRQAAGRGREKFDPLEFDRFTGFQELTRMMAESVNDVKTLQQHLQKSLDLAETDLALQRRMTRDLQQDLMRVRMVPFSSIAERLYRVVRRTAKEVDKRVNLDIRGGSVEIDRAVLERMAGPFEHIVRNHVVHGIETREARGASGKEETGELLIEVRQEGNEVVLVFSDDGAGLDLDRIRAKARESGLIDGADVSDARAAELIFQPGLSTATDVTELAGRGVGMDVVRTEAMTLAGRVTVASVAGKGTRFTLNLPVTLAITQVVLVAAAGRVFALPAALVEQVRQCPAEALADAYRDGQVGWLDEPVPLAFLGTLLGIDGGAPIAQRQSPVLVLRSAGERIAVHVDAVLANQEVVVKNLGPQLARMAGIAGATVLGSGEIVLILNPVQLAQMTRSNEARHVVADAGFDAAARADAAVSAALAAHVADADKLANVMVVDDSLTVRRITQRLLSREGYRVVLAKDGVDALEKMQDDPPDAMLIDIEMPRMDGFDLTRSVRSDPRYRHIPIIMITSRTAEKHRRLAAELGVDAYLGKPYQEDELLSLLNAHVKSTRRHPA